MTVLEADNSNIPIAEVLGVSDNQMRKLMLVAEKWLNIYHLLNVDSQLPPAIEYAVEVTLLMPWTSTICTT